MGGLLGLTKPLKMKPCEKKDSKVLNQGHSLTRVVGDGLMGVRW